MAARLQFKTTPTKRRVVKGVGTGSKALPEHSMVRLKRSLDLGDGRHMPAGSLGAIVFVHGGGAAYEVEFAKPTHAVVTVPAAGVARAIVAG